MPAHSPRSSGLDAIARAADPNTIPVCPIRQTPHQLPATDCPRPNQNTRREEAARIDTLCDVSRTHSCTIYKLCKFLRYCTPFVSHLCCLTSDSVILGEFRFARCLSFAASTSCGRLNVSTIRTPLTLCKHHFFSPSTPCDDLATSAELIP